MFVGGLERFLRLNEQVQAQFSSSSSRTNIKLNNQAQAQFFPKESLGQG